MEVAHMQNTSTEPIRVQYDAFWYEWAPGETKRVPIEAASHFFRWGYDSAGKNALVQLNGDEGSLALAESRLAAALNNLRVAQDLTVKAKDEVVKAERDVKVRKAERDALAKGIDNLVSGKAPEPAGK